MLSKRKLIQLVSENHVSGWDDPRMPTICGVRRRGYTPEAMRKFCERIGVSKYNSTIDVSWLEDALREDLNKKAPRVMGVLRPLKLVIENYPDGQTEDMDAVNNPEDASAGTRKVPFSKVLLRRAGRLPREPIEGLLSARSRPRGAAPLRVLRHLCWGREGRAAVPWSRCAATTTLPLAVATRPTAAK